MGNTNAGDADRARWGDPSPWAGKDSRTDAQAADEDASALEAAAAVLLRRYGQEGAGAVAKTLRETATAIRKPLPTAEEMEILTVEDQMDYYRDEPPGHGYWEAGDLP